MVVYKKVVHDRKRISDEDLEKRRNRFEQSSYDDEQKHGPSEREKGDKRRDALKNASEYKVLGNTYLARENIKDHTLKAADCYAQAGHFLAVGERNRKAARLYTESAKLYEDKGKDDKAKEAREKADYFRHEATIEKLPSWKQPFAWAKDRRRERQRKKDGKGLEGKIASILAIGGFMISIFFISGNFTGFAVFNLNQTISNSTSVIFFILGVVLSYFVIKKDKLLSKRNIM